MNRDKVTSKNKNKEKHKHVFIRIIIAFVSFALIYFILVSTAISQRQSIEEGQIAPETITATRDVVDQYTTDILIKEARNAVSDKFTQDDTITDGVLTELEELYASLQLVRDMGEAERQKEDASDLVPYNKAFLEKVKEELPSLFSNDHILSLLNIEKIEFLMLQEVITSEISSTMNSGVRVAALDDNISSLIQNIRSPLNNFSSDAENIAIDIITTVLEPNFLKDPVATAAARDAAEESVIPKVYKQGANIVRSGEEVTKAQIEALKELGLLDDGSINYTPHLSLLAIAIILFLVLSFYIAFNHKKVFKSPKQLITISAVSILSLLFAWGGSLIQYYLIPIYFSAFICSVVIEKKSLALALNLILSILVSIMSITSGEIIALPILVASLLGGTVAIISLRKTPQRSTIMVAGILSGLASGAVYVVFSLINNQGWMDILLYAGMGLASGLVASILAIGTLPMWESVFRMITPMKLLELANPNQPLLKKLLNEAPGTYHHSIMVGNMAERAAEAVGANTLIVRTGAYYHDIGKIKRPYFFVENQQGGKNPHDNIKPNLSTQIITSHLTDGIELVKKAKLPQMIIDIVAQHHGNSAVMYFYQKTKNEAENPEEINIDDFRYKGKPPITREAAILMLADSVEAAVRSIENPTAQSVRERIDKIFKSRLDDGQLSYCELTMSEIKKVADSFMTALTGLYHERVEYPGDKNER